MRIKHIVIAGLVIVGLACYGTRSCAPAQRVVGVAAQGATVVVDVATTGAETGVQTIQTASH
jgi:hypothetical protein